MPLKCEKKTVIKVYYRDLERYIKELTGKNLEIAAILECGNDTSHEIDVDGDVGSTWEDDKKWAEAFLFGTATEVPTYRLSSLLDVMCMHGMLEPGTYLIDVSW